MTYFYERTLAEVTKPIDDDARDHVDTAAEEIVLEVLRRDSPRERLRSEYEAARTSAGSSSRLTSS